MKAPEMKFTAADKLMGHDLIQSGKMHCKITKMEKKKETIIINLFIIVIFFYFQKTWILVWYPPESSTAF